MSEEEVVAWAVSLFEQVGGEDWRGDLWIGGVTAIIALLFVIGLVAFALVRSHR